VEVMLVVAATCSELVQQVSYCCSVLLYETLLVPQVSNTDRHNRQASRHSLLLLLLLLLLSVMT
jgi:hypothetical protein